MDYSSALLQAFSRATVLVAVLAVGGLFTAGAVADIAHGAFSGGTYPAKLEVLRATVEDGRLDVLADITKRAETDRVRVSFIANGERSAFTAPVEEGRIRFKHLLPVSQRSVSSGIMEIHYPGNARVRSTEVRLRAAKGKARLQREALSLKKGVITARGSLARHAHGVARLILSYERPNGTVGEWQGRARIRDDGSWRVQQELPADAHAGGYLSIQFTGYYPRRVRGEQIAKQLLDGQSFGSGEPTSQYPTGTETAGQAPSLVPTPPPESAPVPAPAPSAPDVQPSTAITRPVGSAVLSDAEAAARVQAKPETRSGNATANAYWPSDAELAEFRAAMNTDNPLFRYVTGRFTGTTDEIIQWVAHKWGIEEDVVRAQMVQESWWNQNAMGDRRDGVDASLYPSQSRIDSDSVYESLGISQIKWRPNGSANPGTEPLRWESTAFNLDYYGASIRFYYDGLCSWCGTGYSAGQFWPSVGAHFQPLPWGNAGAQDYITKVQNHLANRTWAQPGF